MVQQEAGSSIEAFTTPRQREQMVAEYEPLLGGQGAAPWGADPAFCSSLGLLLGSKHFVPFKGVSHMCRFKKGYDKVDGCHVCHYSLRHCHNVSA